MGKQDERTNVMRILDQKKIAFREYHLEGSDGSMSGVEMAARMGFPEDQTFKTLVARGKTGQLYVFIIPVADSLDLKKAAAAVGEKSMAMILSRELLPNTGYIHGGCSPIGMKKLYPTVLHETAMLYDEIYFSAGRIGYQVCVNPDDLHTVVPYEYADVVVD